ncbi:hypothetical protein G6F40_015325 [Rhizopus arrhizus]|nr:hypothetical protein G6F40_015325 [Rhizopus arrhizus]
MRRADPQPFQAGRHDGFRLVIPARIEHLHQVVEQVETTDRQHRRTQRGDRDGQRDLASDALAFGVHHSVQEAVADAADGGGNADHAHVLQLAPQFADMTVDGAFLGIALGQAGMQQVHPRMHLLGRAGHVHQQAELGEGEGQSISNGPCRISPLGSSVTVLALRRSTAWMRATISAGLNGLAT